MCANTNTQKQQKHTTTQINTRTLKNTQGMHTHIETAHVIDAKQGEEVQRWYTHTHTHTHTQTHALSLSLSHTHAHIHKHTHTHAHIYTDVHKHSDKQTHTFTNQKLSSSSSAREAGGCATAPPLTLPPALDCCGTTGVDSLRLHHHTCTRTIHTRTHTHTHTHTRTRKHIRSLCGGYGQ